MDDELARLLTLVDHQGDAGAVERWFTAVEESYRSSDGQAESWDQFAARFYEAASSFDSSTVNWFLEKAGSEFDDQFRVVERFYTQVGVGRATASYEQARTELGLGTQPATEEASAEPDWDRFAAFLGRNDHDWQATWPETREWLAYTARHEEGFGPEIESFESYADAGWDLADNLTAHNATPAAAASAAEPDWDRFAAFLGRNDFDWQATWPESQAWLLYAARNEEKFGVEVDAFEGQALEESELNVLLEAFGARVRTESLEITYAHDISALERELLSESPEFSSLPATRRRELIVQSLSELLQ